MSRFWNGIERMALGKFSQRDEMGGGGGGGDGISRLVQRRRQCTKSTALLGECSIAGLFR